MAGNELFDEKTHTPTGANDLRDYEKHAGVGDPPTVGKLEDGNMSAEEKRTGDVESGRPALSSEFLPRRVLGDKSILSNRRPEDEASHEADIPPLKGLSLLDRFLVIWILLAMAIGIILGNTVPSTGPALQKGTFVGVSVPIGMSADFYVTMMGVTKPS